ncbi:hypothetical protein LNN31_13770 [Acetobacterium wieringae]|uniref:DUF5651 domain-containing protein n=1 Tax=Acetobacterium wieringae TaxID=52694 RepID=A0ABY6HE48_9FIRM|nr:hypothetical protein [Acetobacterium wieringae]UYO61843.1 hypothetical protein LNN31_13770 [Acetobacterium wieringae]
MAKNYLCKDEQTQFLFMFTVLDMIDNIMDREDKNKKNHNPSNFHKDELKDFRYARTHLNKALTHTIQRIGGDIGQRLINKLKDAEPTLKDKSFRKEESGTLINDEMLLEMVSKLIEIKCRGCKVCNYRDCHIFNINNELGVGVEDGRSNEICPFVYTERAEVAS